jgi:hypothetical protein
MSRNAIQESIPYELSQLSSLDVLDLSDNQLSGIIPYNFRRYGNQLSILIFSNNNRHGIILPMFPPQSLLLGGNCRYLNKLSCLSNNMCQEMLSLVTQYLGNNEITNGFHDLIHDLHYIEIIRLLYLGFSIIQAEGVGDVLITVSKGNRVIISGFLNVLSMKRNIMSMMQLRAKWFIMYLANNQMEVFDANHKTILC